MWFVVVVSCCQSHCWRVTWWNISNQAFTSKK
jgi:hypothetical protein